MQKKKWKVVLKLIFIIALFACISLTNGEGRKVTIAEEIASDLVTLPQRVIVYAKNFFKEDKNIFFQNVETLKDENDSLKGQIEELENQMLDYEMLKAENETLKKHAVLEASYPNYEVVVADIVMTSSSNWSLIYTLNKGEKDGIKPKMAVICKEGLVGYVETVTANTAKVVSILDAGNAVSARITRTRDVVVAKGNLSLANKNQVKIENIPIGVSLIEGDKIETSGLGGIYPKGILIGKVKKFDQKNNPIENEAIAESLVDFEKLETVAVIKK